MHRAVAVLVCALCHINAYQVEVKVEQGKLIGIRALTVFDQRLYFAFYGVPYAQPPVGKLRFKDPKLPKKWKKPFVGTDEYHGACAQAHIVQKQGLYGYEDCLHLNIFTPNLPRVSDQLKAVVVWIHGYAFGSSFSHIHGPDFFIDNDVLFISLTHRIGAFGFLKINQTDTHANMGLKDIVIALKWIRRNIKQLGGNKNNITVMGSDSAATLISLLCVTKYEKYFSKVILQSGSLFNPALFQASPTVELTRLQAYLKSKGHNAKSAPAKTLIESMPNIYNIIELTNTQRPLIPFLPMLEEKSNKSLLTKDLINDFRKTLYANMAKKSILIGFNSQESISEATPFIRNPHNLKKLSADFKFMVPFFSSCKYNHGSTTYKQIGDQIRRGYFRKGISEKSLEIFLRYVTDLHKYPIYDFIQKYLQGNEKGMYVYKFSYNGNFNAVKASSVAGVSQKIRGAANGDEICYILKCEPIWENYVKVNRDNNNRNRKFIQQITELWANFAKTGNPTPTTYKGNVTWPPMTTLQDKMLKIGNTIQVGDSKYEKRMYRFWNDIYSKYYENCKPIQDEL